MTYLSPMWQTIIDIPASVDQFTHKDKILSMGSCFADEIGERLRRLSFDIVVNPLGILYNPVSLARILGLIADLESWDEGPVFCHEGKWRHFDFHSRVSKSDKTTFIDFINETFIATRKHLSNVSLTMITLGSSFVWETLDGNIVGNCHKMPSQKFNRRMLSTEEIHDALVQSLHAINVVNPKCNLLLTVSPIRHKRDGLVESSWSKARLLDVCRTFSSQESNVTYFPSYELMMDELRDYRYYKKDMIHPSDAATDYIFDRFFNTHFAAVPDNLIRLINKINNSYTHRPLQETSDEHQSLIARRRQWIKEAKDQYGINVKDANIF